MSGGQSKLAQSPGEKCTEPRCWNQLDSIGYDVVQGDPHKSPHKAAESDPKSVVILGPCGKEAGGFWRILRWALRGYDGNCFILTDAVPRAPDGIQWQQSRLLLFRCDEASLTLADRAFESGALVAVVVGGGRDR